MYERYSQLAARAVNDDPLSEADALWVLEGDDVELLPLLQAAFEPRRRHFGRQVMVHILNNAQNGLCPEDCGYCSQNKDSQSEIRKYALKTDDQILAEADAAARAGASRYCIVLSGRGPTLDRTQHLAGVIREIKQRYPIEVCLSAGLMDEHHTRLLADAGLDRLNHNLNSSEAHYDAVCTTHTYADRLGTLRAAQAAGLQLCSGLIMGMGERSEDIVEVAMTLRRMEVPSIPVNFLIPIDGNQLMTDGSLTPERCLRGLCMMRLANPRAEIRIAGGREGHLRSLQALALYPANSLFVQGYLTTRGDTTDGTYKMIRDAGFEVAGNPLYDAAHPDPAAAFELPGGGDILKREVARSKT